MWLNPLSDETDYLERQTLLQQRGGTGGFNSRNNRHFPFDKRLASTHTAYVLSDISPTARQTSRTANPSPVSPRTLPARGRNLGK